jgi:hypothetical protein
MAKFIITVEGDAPYINAGLDSFARANGFVESEDPEALTAIQVAEAAIKRYFRETVSAYNSQQAAELARQAAIGQSILALDETTLVISVEE